MLHSAERLGRNQRFASTGGVLAAGLMGFIAYFLSYRAIFIVAAALVLPLLLALGRIQPSDIHFGRASCIPDHHGPGAPPRARLRSLWKTPGLLIFAGCVFLFQMANASMLPLAGEAFAYSKDALSSLIVDRAHHGAAGHRRDNGTVDRTPGESVGAAGQLLLIGFAALPIRALPVSLDRPSDNSHRRSGPWRISGTMLGVLTALTVADLTAGSGEFNLAQGFVGTISGIGASLSTTFFRPRCRKPWPRGRISWHFSGGPGRRASVLAADA